MQLDSKRNRHLQEQIINTVARKLQYLHKMNYRGAHASYAPVWYTIAAFERQVPSLIKHHTLRRYDFEPTDKTLERSTKWQKWFSKFPGRHVLASDALPKALSYKDIKAVFHRFDTDVRNIKFTEHDKDVWCRYAIALSKE